MKKLKLINHLGETEVELDVYVDGQSLDWRSPTLKAIWLTRITLQGPDEPVEEKADTISEETKKPELTEFFESVLTEEVKPEPEHITKIPPHLVELEQGLNQEGLTLKTLEVVDEKAAIKAAAAVKRECSECGWTGTQGECSFGHHDFYCPNCGKETLKEVTDEPKTTGDKSPRKRRTGKTGTSKDSKKLPKKRARG